ncbi:MAG: hypothetical protein ACJ756_00825 [Solirubrobacterales bacterium]
MPIVRADGQATVEYTAVIAVIAVVLGVGAAVVTVTGVGDRLLYAMRQGICAVGGVLCPPPPEPCVLSRHAQRDSGSVVILAARLGQDQALIVERRSDGKVAVTVTGGRHGGAEFGLGAGVNVEAGKDSAGAGAEVRAAATTRVGGGRTWILPSEAAARKLVDALGQGETIPLIDAPVEAIDELFGGGEHVRAPDIEWSDAGTGGGASASAAVGPAGLDAAAAISVAAGLKTDHRTGRRVVFLRLDDSGSAALTTKVIGAGAGQKSIGTVAIAFDRHGKPAALTANASAQVEGTAQLPPGLSLTKEIRALLHGHAGAGARLEVDATLDLTAPANAEAAKRLIEALRHPEDPAGAMRAVSGLADRLVTGARLDARLYSMGFDSYGGGGRVKVGLGVGANVDHRVEDSRLLGAWERPPDSAWHDRRDCTEAARRLAA